MQWFDAGVNCFDNRLPLHQTLADAKAYQVNKLCVIATHENDWEACITARQAYPQHIVHTLGVHPHHADEVQDGWQEKLKDTIQRSDAVAIGECGLDFNRMFSSKSAQLNVFEQQLSIAVDMGLPVYLHERDAFDDQLRLLKKYRAKLAGGIVHCFTGGTEQLTQYLALDLYIGITGWVCDPKRGQALQQAVQSLPLNRLMVETDAPYLFPKTLKPRRSSNVPANLPHIGETLAGLMDVSIEQIAQSSYANAIALFQRPTQTGLSK